MIRKPVTSSILKSVGYDADTSTLEISFRYGIVNQYFGVRTHYLQWSDERRFQT
ncbi:KTSC domain-containing protein [Erwinia sp. E_sp_W01_6]|uniref:KTSC domain-containing protein n=1 Tax=Erwinia sp. E_sp_W01_6 TaxID=3039408 RepID=UPI0030D0454F